MSLLLALLDWMPVRVKALFVFWPVVFVVGYFMWSSAASARKYPTESFWRQFFWYWRRDPEEPASSDAPPVDCPRCGSFTVHLNDVASYCPSCRREVVRPGAG